MVNLKDEILKLTDSEIIEAVVIGHNYWLEEYEDKIPWEKKGVILSWEEAKKLLDFEYESDYGKPEGYPVFVWTKTKLIITVIYDGKIWLEALPRNPVPCKPHFVGGI
ncbi:MAG: hypothetical protein DRO00_05035 [Thermoproteota archaeon]|nr:MAG: hypothetical protein DRO00_05035 [Candidatus Korarchaeota archaeon]